MAEITVYPHGDRWAVAERGATSPTQEFPSREAAEMAARSMAGGGEVEVRDDDPTGLDHVAPGDAGQATGTADGGPVQPVEDAEDPRATQGGL